MIGRLAGILIEKNPPELMLDINGIGYEVAATMNTFYQLPECGQKVVLFTHMVVREDAQLLYGFYSKGERSLFRILIKVSGVGPKMALAILSGIEPDVFVTCVHENNITALTRIPGVGKKTAERLVIEVKDKLKDWSGVTSSNYSSVAALSDDAVSALMALGYKEKDAAKAIKQIYSPDLSSEDLIREALKSMVAV